MTFKKGIFKKSHFGRKMLFNSCNECGKRFSGGEIFWKRSTLNAQGVHIFAYLCEQCYEKKFIDL